MTPDLLQPVLLSLRVALLALALAIPPGLSLAWWLAGAARGGAGRNARRLLEAALLLPLVLPPSVVGYLLIVFLGRGGPIGGVLDAMGIHLAFTPAAAVIAAAIVALPLLARTAQAAFQSVPAELVDVGRTLGLPPAALFFRIALPAAWRGVVAGAALAFARALGEFGATLMFAGNIPGRTNTMALEIYSAWETGDPRTAWIYVGLLVLTSLAVVAVSSRLSPRRWR